MNNKIRCIILLIFTAINTNAQIDLHQKISIHAQNTSIPEVLNLIEQHSDFYFAYNPDYFSSNEKISINKDNVPIKQVLDKVLSKNFTYKVIGDHIILHPKSEKKQTAGYTISGIIKGANNSPCDSVIIYAVEENKAFMTSPDGSYHMVLQKFPQCINISHSNYRDTLVFAENIGNGSTIQLKPLETNKLETLSTPDIQFENIAFVKHLVPQSAMLVSKQVKITQWNAVKVSFLPGVGSEMLVKGLDVNKLSISILSGYSKGVSGFEVGGLANIIQGNVEGAQIAGVSNVVNNETVGFQAAGVFNYNFGRVTGVQISGVGNIVRNKTNGVQISGVYNQNKGKINGAQISGVANLNSDEVSGIQLSGVANILTDKIHGVQLSGVYNLASYIEGLQLTGVMNHCTGDVNGVQISSVLNKAGTVNGLQFGLVNIADSVGTGLQFGLFNIVKNGYRAFELTSNETFAVDFMYKTGGKKLYSIINAAIDKNELGIGYGIGFRQPFSKKFSGNIDGIATTMFSTKHSFTFQGKKASLRLGLNYDFIKHLGITGGISLNLFNPDSKDEKEISNWPKNLSFKGDSNSLITQSIQDKQNVAWLGWFVGLRF